MAELQVQDKVAKEQMYVMEDLELPLPRKKPAEILKVISRLDSLSSDDYKSKVVDKCHIQSWPTHWLVSSHGDDPKKQWQGQNLCRPKQVEWVRQKGEPTTSSSRQKSREIGRLQSVLKTWRELRILADKASVERTLTRFITPWGRFCFNVLPFRITSGFEKFQKNMSQILQGWEGVECNIDDVLVHGKDQTKHDQRFEAVLVRLVEAGVTLNLDKCQFSTDRATFLGHAIRSSGIEADPEKLQAIADLPPP